MTLKQRLAALERATPASRSRACPACGVALDCLVVVREGEAAPPAANCPTCAPVRQVLTVRFVAPTPKEAA